MLIKCENNLPDNSLKTYLAYPEVAGTGVLRWKSYNGFSASWGLQIGNTGEEKSEIVLLGTAAVTGTAGTLTANTRFDHPADTPIYGIIYNQVVFERSTDGTAGTAAPITDGTVTITPDSQFTIFNDTSGSASYAYKTYFRNSVLNQTTTESDWQTSAGFKMYSLGSIRERIKSKLPKADFVTDSEIDGWVNEWLEAMTNGAIDVNEDYAIGTTEIAFSGTAQEGTITAEDFKQVRRAWYTENGTDAYQMTKQEMTGFYPNEVFNESHPYYYMKGDNIIGRNPHTSTGTIQLAYYKLNPILDSDGDSLPVPMRGYSTSFVKWGLAQAKRKDNKEQEAVQMEQDCRVDLDRFKKELTPRNKSGPTYIDVVEEFGEGEEPFFW